MTRLCKTPTERIATLHSFGIFGSWRPARLTRRADTQSNLAHALMASAPHVSQLLVASEVTKFGDCDDALRLDFSLAI
jgi:hypothetical protein